MSEPIRVTQLVSSYAPSNTEAAAGLVRSAKVAWTLFFTEIGQQCVQVNHLLASRISDPEDVVRFLSELYSRAVFDTVFAMYFDRHDPGIDRAVLRLVTEGYSQGIACAVYANVEKRGVVLGSGPVLVSPAREWRITPRQMAESGESAQAEAIAAATRAVRSEAGASSTASRFLALLRRNLPL